MKAIPAIAVTALLAGCTSPWRSSLAETRLTDQQRTVATQATSDLRYKFNNAACSAIFSDAGAIFKTAQSEQAWMGDCSELRDTLGAWRDFSMKHSEVFGWNGMRIVGHASFDKASRELTIVWGIEDGKPRLSWMSIQDGPKSRMIPEPRSVPSEPGRPIPSTPGWPSRFRDVPPPGQRSA